MSPLSPLGIFAFAGAAGGDYESIETISVGSGGASSITFSSIPSTYKHLQLRGIGQSSRSGGGTGPLSVRFNSDTGSNYRGHIVYGEGSNTAAYAPAVYTYAYCGFMTGNLTGAYILTPFIIDVLDYASTSKNKTIRTLFGTDTNGSGQDLGLGSGAWFNSSTAVNSITVFSDGNTLSQYSEIGLYGIKG